MAHYVLQSCSKWKKGMSLCVWVVVWRHFIFEDIEIITLNKKKAFPIANSPSPPLLLMKWDPSLEPSPSCSAVIEPLRGSFPPIISHCLTGMLPVLSEGWGLMFSPAQVYPASHWLRGAENQISRDMWGDRVLTWGKERLCNLPATCSIDPTLPGRSLLLYLAVSGIEISYLLPCCRPYPVTKNTSVFWY